MPIKVFFVGNPLTGDDGVGPYLYGLLKDDPRLASCELFEVGTVGVDLISYVEDGDAVVIVDAVQSPAGIGQVVVLDERDLLVSLPLSPHDLGVEHTLALLRAFRPKLAGLTIVGIKADKLGAVRQGLSEQLLENIDRIKQQVVEHILEVSKSA